MEWQQPCTSSVWPTQSINQIKCLQQCNRLSGGGLWSSYDSPGFIECQPDFHCNIILPRLSMSRDFLKFSPTRAGYSARVIVVFITLLYSKLYCRSCPVILCSALRSLGGLVRSSALCYHTVNLCSLRDCKTKFRFCMKPRHAVMLLTVFMLLRIIRNFLKGISFLYVGHSSVAILMTTHRRKIFMHCGVHFSRRCELAEFYLQ